MKRRSDRLNQQEAGKLISELARFGYTGLQLAPLIKAGVTREAVAKALIEIQRQAPKEP